MIIWIFPEYRYLNIRYYEYCLNIDILTYDINISQHMIARNMWLAEKRMNIGRDMVSPPLPNQSLRRCKAIITLFVLGGREALYCDHRIFTAIHRGQISVNFTPHMCLASCHQNWQIVSFICVFRYVHKIYLHLIQYSVCCNSNSIHPADKK